MSIQHFQHIGNLLPLNIMYKAMSVLEHFPFQGFMHLSSMVIIG